MPRQCTLPVDYFKVISINTVWVWILSLMNVSYSSTNSTKLLLKHQMPDTHHKKITYQCYSYISTVPSQKKVGDKSTSVLGLNFFFKHSHSQRFLYKNYVIFVVLSNSATCPYSLWFFNSCVRARERESEWVSECEREWESEWVWVCVCVCVCVGVREKERAWVWVSVWVCVCVCERERDHKHWYYIISHTAQFLYLVFLP